ncbi:hypothetical protein ACFQ0B_75055 [Nonomuraea thailandensis]
MSWPVLDPGPQEVTPAQAGETPPEQAPAQEEPQDAAQAQAPDATGTSEQLPASSEHPGHGPQGNGHGWGAKMSPKGWH